MGLIIKEIFDSIQGEGQYTGELMSFIRLAGCNINCPIKKNCDTDYNGGLILKESDIIDQVNNKIVTITGGEPLEQDIYKLCRLLRQSFHQVHIQTSGLIDISKDLFALTNYVVCSPKAKVDKLKLHRVDEVKVVYYGQDVSQYYQYGGCRNHYIQPLEKNGKYNYRETIQELKRLNKTGQKWRLSLQNHKYIGIK